MNTITEIIAYLKSNRDELGITLELSAHAELINQVEETYNIKLPDDIRTFYEFANGFESDDFMFRIIPLEEMVENRRTYNYNELCIAEYMIYSDTWNLIIDQEDNKYRIVNGNHSDEKIVTLTNSLADFLQRFIDGGLLGKNGLYYWYNELIINRITKSSDKLVATFKLEGTFHITGRGLVISGQIIQGKLLKGDIFWFEEDGYKTVIDIESIEFGHSGKNSFVGLMLGKHISKETERSIKNLTGSPINIYRF
ncbi:MAG: SMI1/KNR4 family protein [Bacteroidota bacterium]